MPKQEPLFWVTTHGSTAFALIAGFAALHGLLLKRENGELIIPCQQGEIYQRDSNSLAAVLRFDKPDGWNAARSALVASGAIVLASQDKRGAVGFDRTDGNAVETLFRCIQPVPIAPEPLKSNWQIRAESLDGFDSANEYATGIQVH